MNTGLKRVVSVVISHGERWNFLDKTIDAILLDANVIMLIIVDNGILDQEALNTKTLKLADKVIVLHQEKNMGSAGGFAIGIEAARSIDCDYVYLSDDDMVPESCFVEKYLEVIDIFKGKKVVISGHRIDVPGNTLKFYKLTISTTKTKKSFFEVFSIKKIINFLNTLFRKTNNIAEAAFIPIVPICGFVYGGAFLPIEAIRDAPLPDKSLFLYGDDIAYSWGVEALGYASYSSYSPIIHDIDMTFPGSHIYGLYDKSTAPFKVYYRIRNMVRISIEHSEQSKFVLFCSIFFWIFGLLFIGLKYKGPTIQYFSRVKLILSAVSAGFNKNKPVPEGFPS